MKFNVNETVAFTGHRPQALGGFSRNQAMNAWVIQSLGTTIDLLIGAGYKTFITGGALGVDTWAAIEVLNRRHLGAKLIIAIPCDNQDSPWSEEDRKVYARTLGDADAVYQVIPGEYAGWKMQRRNEWMVNNANRIVAVWNGDNHGGTYNCVIYARSQCRPIHILNPRGRTIVHPEITPPPANRTLIGRVFPPVSRLP